MPSSTSHLLDLSAARTVYRCTQSPVGQTPWLAVAAEETGRPSETEERFDIHSALHGLADRKIGVDLVNQLLELAGLLYRLLSACCSCWRS